MSETGEFDGYRRKIMAVDGFDDLVPLLVHECGIHGAEIPPAMEGRIAVHPRSRPAGSPPLCRVRQSGERPTPTARYVRPIGSAARRQLSGSKCGVAGEFVVDSANRVGEHRRSAAWLHRRSASAAAVQPVAICSGTPHRWRPKPQRPLRQRRRRQGSAMRRGSRLRAPLAVRPVIRGMDDTHRGADRRSRGRRVRWHPVGSAAWWNSQAKLDARMHTLGHLLG